MKRVSSSRLLGTVAIVFALLAAVSMAQAQPGRQGPPPDSERNRQTGINHEPGSNPPPGGPRFDLMFSEMRFDNRLVKGAPYSATAVTENVQALADGTRITNKTTATVARDSEGRTRREQTLNIAGPFGAHGDPPQLVFINDVVAGVRYVLDVRSQTARKQPSSRNMPPPGMPPPAPAQGKTETLEKQTIEGVEVEGTRTTVTTPAGQIGNDRPIEIVSERWESPELKVVVLSKHKDPRIGEITYRLTNISRGEPAKSLFEVPTGYTTVEGNSPNRRGGPPMGRGRRPDGIKFD